MNLKNAKLLSLIISNGYSQSIKLIIFPRINIDNK